MNNWWPGAVKCKNIERQVRAAELALLPDSVSVSRFIQAQAARFRYINASNTETVKAREMS
jgi:hypothetical protein